MGQKFRSIRNSFNGGEISPQIALARPDLDFYRKGCSELLNFIPMLRGGITRRPGFVQKTIPTTEGSGDVVAADVVAGMAAVGDQRVFRFKYGSDQEYAVVFIMVSEYDPDEGETVSKLEIWIDCDPYFVIDGLEGMYTGAGELAAIQYFQTGDVLFLFHPDYPTQRLERHADDDWRLVEHSYVGGPFDSINVDTSQSVALVIPEWNPAADPVAARSTGEIVIASESVTSTEPPPGWRISGYQYVYLSTSTVSSHFYYYTNELYYKLRLSIDFDGATNEFQTGSNVYITGVSNISGWKKIVGRGTSYIEINIGTKRVDYYERPSPRARYYELVSSTWKNKLSLSLDSESEVHYVSSVTETTVNVYLLMALHDDVTDADDIPDGDEDENWRKVPASLGTVTASASEDLFDETDVGRKLMLGRDTVTSIEETFEAAGDVSEAVACANEIRLVTRGGAWSGLLVLRESTDNGSTWEDVGEIRSENNSYNGEITRTATSIKSVFRVEMREYDVSWTVTTGATSSDTEYATGCQWVLEPQQVDNVYGTIAEFVDAQTVTVQLDTPLQDTLSSTRWALGTFGGSNGYPACGCIHQEGFMVSGVPTKPGWWFRSQLNNWNRFDEGLLATSAILFQIPSSFAEHIRWVASKGDVLVLGTDLAEWKIYAPSSTSSLAYDNVGMKQISAYGSAAVQPVHIEDAVVFCTQDRRTLRVMRYTYETDEMSSAEILDIMSEHLPAADTMLMEVDKNRNLIWILDTAGNLCSVTYDSANKVLAWARHKVVLPVNTPVNGFAGMIVTESSLILSANVTEAYGEVTLFVCNFDEPVWSDEGGDYVSFVRPTPLTQDGENLGISGAMRFKCSALDLVVLDSTGGEVSVDGDTWYALDLPADSYTGRVRVETNCRISAEPAVQVRSSGAQALTLLALACTIETTNTEID